MNYTDADYVRYNPFADERDVDIRCRTVKMVTTRAEHLCIGGQGKHQIPAGCRCRYERALVDGEWGSYYTCVECMDEWLADALGPRRRKRP